LRRYALIPPKSAHQKQLDKLHALLKVAVLKRDNFQCVMCGKPAVQYPIHPYDFLDVSHIFPKSIYPLARFNLLNVVMHCRKCHEWWHANIQQAAEWIRQYLGPVKYKMLLDAVTNPDPMFRDYAKVEMYLRQAIRRYS